MSLLVSSWTINQANLFATEDATLICTGNQLRWISLSAFYETGQLSFIEAPENAPESIDEVDCVYSFLAEPTTDTFNSVQLLASFNAYKSYAASINQRPYTLFAYQTSQSRAPPLS